MCFSYSSSPNWAKLSSLTPLMNLAPEAISPEKPIPPARYWPMTASVSTISSADICRRLNFSFSSAIAE